MIGETNINGSAGLNGEGALLKINAETGSTITVSKEGYSKVIKTSQLDSDNNNRSYWFFQTKDFGEWTVTATKGEKIKSDTALITSEGQSVSVALSYSQYFYSNNNQYTDITGGYSIKANQGNENLSFPNGDMQINVQAWNSEIDGWDAWVVTNNKVEITGNILTCIGSKSSNVRWGISDDQKRNSFVASKNEFGDLDVSANRGGTYYIKVHTSAGSGGGQSTVTVNSILNH